MSRAPASVRTPLREHVPSVLVASLSAAFGVGLLQVTGFLAAAIAVDNVTGGSNTVALLLQIVAIVFIVIAVYVGAIITANTFATIVAGRARSIALLRLLGSSASSQRTAIAAEGLFVGVAGTVIGAAIGTGMAVALGRIVIALGIVPEVSYGYWDPVLILPLVGVILTTWTASWVGSRRVLSVTPLQALGGSEELSREEAVKRPGRNVLALVLTIIGFGFLALGILIGLVNPLGVLVGWWAGVVSFTGIVFAADVVMPPALRLVGRMLGRSAAARLAAENALRHPQRSSRATIGLVIGVTLLMTFGVAMATWQQMILAAQAQQPRGARGRRGDAQCGGGRLLHPDRIQRHHRRSRAGQQSLAERAAAHPRARAAAGTGILGAAAAAHDPVRERTAHVHRRSARHRARRRSTAGRGRSRCSAG